MVNSRSFVEISTFLNDELQASVFQVLACANLETDNCMLDQESGLFKSVILIGNVGSGFWPSFRASSEYQDGLGDPLDRYSKRIIGEVGKKLEGAQTCFPSDGPPYAPFQSWAMASGLYHQSPMAVLIHQDFGLWTAFRGAILLPFEMQGLKEAQRHSPCISCQDKPCLNICPVNAFKAGEDGESFGSYDVENCRALVAHKGECYQSGCLARRACPVAPALSYSSEQVKFHMKTFISG